MNNNTNDAISAAAIIKEAYQGDFSAFALFSSIALLLYTTVLSMRLEIEYIWLKRFSLPNLFYIFTRHGTLVAQAFAAWNGFMLPGRSCLVVVSIVNAADFLAFVGIQGLLITRAYSVCSGNKRIIAGVLALLFLAGCIIFVSEISLSPGCVSYFSALDRRLSLVFSICATCTDILVFGVTLRAVWSTWKLKRGTGIKGNTGDIVFTLLNQTVMRFCFACFITVSTGILANQVTNEAVLGILNRFQNSLSAILVADGLLELRRQNSAAIEARNTTSLLSIRFGNILHRMHESIIVEMGDHERANRIADGEEVDGVGQPGFSIGLADDVEVEAENVSA